MSVAPGVVDPTGRGDDDVADESEEPGDEPDHPVTQRREEAGYPAPETVHCPLTEVGHDLLLPDDREEAVEQEAQ